MIWQNPKPEDLKLTNAVNRLLDEMDTYGPDSPEYDSMLTHLEKLTELQDNRKSKRQVSPDQVLLVAGNLLGILVIVAYEQKHVMVSKGMNFIMKVR